MQGLAKKWAIVTRVLSLVTSLGAVTAAVPQALAQDVEWPPRNTVVIRLGDRFAVEYERAVHPQVSLFLGPALVAGIVDGNRSVAKNEFGVGSSLGARFFVRGRAPEGLFIGPLLYLGYSHISEAGQSATGLRLSSGAMVGYTAIFFDIFVVSLGVGASYLNVTHVVNAADAPGPVETNLRFALGVAF